MGEDSRLSSRKRPFLGVILCFYEWPVSCNDQMYQDIAKRLAVAFSSVAGDIDDQKRRSF
jgi:hypothetical protein